VLEGNPSHRPINRGEPAAVGLPACPAWLSDGAKREWYVVVAGLAAVPGLLSAVDRMALACYCAACARLESLTADYLAAGGKSVYRSESGQVKRNPLLIVIHETENQVKAFAAEFGMTPASRSRISVGGAGVGKDALDDFIDDGTQIRTG